MVRQFALDFNCGFACTAVRELIPKTHGKQTVDQLKRAQDFKQLFADVEEFGFPETYFDGSKNGSLFDRDCNTILKIWSKNWSPPENRLNYEHIFSVKNWMCLAHKGQHTFAKCQACFLVYGDVQKTFPRVPSMKKHC